MTDTRRRVLFFLLLSCLVLAGLVLSEIFWTVLFAATVAYVLVPLHSWLTARGVRTQLAAAVASLIAVAILSGFVSLAVYLLYRRRSSLVEFVSTLPETVELSAFDVVYVIETESTLREGLATLTNLAFQWISGFPSLALKLTVFAFVVFALLIGHESVEETFLNLVPADYRDVAVAFGARIRRTLYAIYVLQVATGFATFFFALPVFYVLGYDIALSLAFAAGLLQFLPIVGPSILIVGLGVAHVMTGQIEAAIGVLVLGGFFIAFLPDVVVRPRLAQRTGRLRGTLYFVGFIGGLLTVGAIGIIVGPLVVALVVEAMAQLESEAT